MSTRITLFSLLSFTVLSACAEPTAADFGSQVSSARGGADRETSGGDTSSDKESTVEEDESARADRAELEGLTAELLRSLGLDQGEVSIDYIGRSEPREQTENSDDVYADADLSTESRSPEGIRSLRAYNPTSGNEFRLNFSERVLPTAGDAAEREGLQYGSDDEGDAEVQEEELLREAIEAASRGGEAPPSWSGNVDNRVRLSNTAAEAPGTTGTTVWPWRAIVRLSNGCTGTLVGPRHVVTAGHCIWSRTSMSWMTFNVTPGQAGTTLAPYGSVAFPSSGFNWYFTPDQWRQTSPSGGAQQYDFGLLVLPQSIGEQTGWMGWWVEGSSTLTKDSHFNRGYPACAATASNGLARLDDPGDPGSSVVCVSQHLYGDSNNCSVGEFSTTDADGWSRLFKHSCDASAGQSGSSIYHYEDGAPVVSGIHTTSGCGSTSAAAACTASDTRPLTATRITPEYGDIIGFFRNWKP